MKKKKMKTKKYDHDSFIELLNQLQSMREIKSITINGIEIDPASIEQ